MVVTTERAACPTEIAALHASYEAAWLAYNSMDIAGLPWAKQNPHVQQAMNFSAEKSDRLSLAVLASAPTCASDLVTLALHLAIELERELPANPERDEVIRAAVDALLAYLLRDAPAPKGEIGEAVCEFACKRTSARMIGALEVEAA